MAHDTDAQGNYIRLYTTTINGVRYGIGFAEIAKCLGRTTQDIGQLAGDVNASGVRVGCINMAAKFKPVRKGNMWFTQGDWWMGDDGKCGLDITVYDDLEDFVEDMIAACKSGGVIDYTSHPLPWTYNPPRGGDAPGDIEPYRDIQDFHRYNKNAVFTKPRLQTDKKISIDTGGTIDDNNLYTIDFPDSVTYADGNTLASEGLGLDDIRPTGTTGSELSNVAPLSDYYLGIIFVDCDNTSSWVVGTAEDALGDFVSGWVGMTVEHATQLSAAVANKEIAMIPFLSSEVVTDFNSETLDGVSGAFMSSYGTSPTKAWVHRFGMVDLAITLNNKSWSGSNTGGDLLGTIDIEVCSGPNHTNNFTLSSVDVGIQRLKNGSWVDVSGVGFTASSVTMYYGADEPATGSIVLNRNGQGTNVIHMDDTDTEFVWGGTYRLTLYVGHSNPTEINPDTPSVVYSDSFVIGS